MALPDDFRCRITNWDYIYNLCRTVSEDVRTDGYDPDVIVALARGGWFAGRCLCDFLGKDSLASLKVEHYVGAAEKGEEAKVRYPMPEGTVEDRDVLIVDDIADTGGSLERAIDYARNHEAQAIRTATLQLLDTSEIEPDYVGERLDNWAWIVYPWNFIEDMTEIVGKILSRVDEPLAPEQIRYYLDEFHDVDSIELEVAQPRRLTEVLTTMKRRGLARQTEDGWIPVGDHDEQ